MEYLKEEEEPEWYDEQIGIDFIDRKVKAVGFDWLSPLQKSYYFLGKELERCL